MKQLFLQFKVNISMLCILLVASSPYNDANLRQEDGKQQAQRQNSDINSHHMFHTAKKIKKISYT